MGLERFSWRGEGGVLTMTHVNTSKMLRRVPGSQEVLQGSATTAAAFSCPHPRGIQQEGRSHRKEQGKQPQQSGQGPQTMAICGTNVILPLGESEAPKGSRADGLATLHSAVSSRGTPGSPGARCSPWEPWVGLLSNIQIPGPRPRARVRGSGDGARNSEL